MNSLLFTIETQPKWYIPAPKVLGWHIGFWNFIGGIGFTVSYQSPIFRTSFLFQWHIRIDKRLTSLALRCPRTSVRYIFWR